MLPVDHPKHPELLTILQAIEELREAIPIKDQPLIAEALSAKARQIVQEYPAKYRAWRNAGGR